MWAGPGRRQRPSLGGVFAPGAGHWGAPAPGEQKDHEYGAGVSRRPTGTVLRAPTCLFGDRGVVAVVVAAAAELSAVWPEAVVPSQ